MNTPVHFGLLAALLLAPAPGGRVHAVAPPDSRQASKALRPGGGPLLAASDLGPSAGVSLSDEDQVRLVLRLSALIAEHYARPELTDGIAKDLQAWLEGGAARSARSPRDFAGALTARLGAIDRHFLVTWTPPGEVHPKDPMHDSDPKALEETVAWARRENFGFTRVEIMPGNVGYISLEAFHDASYAGEAAAAAMAMVSNVDALIFDLRNNTGGEPSMVQLLISYLVPANRPVELMRMIQRRSNGNEVRQTWTLPYVPGRRIPDVPVFVLTSRKTGSAAEAFAYDLQALGRGHVVGQVSIGAALPVEEFTVGEGFYANISNKRTENPITGTNWQDVGVRPDTAVDDGDALLRARGLALELLAKRETDPQKKKELRWAEEELRLSARPTFLEAARGREYVGVFGDRKIWWEPDGLRYRRASRSPKRMLPVVGDTFVHEGVAGFRTHFERDRKGAIVRLVDEWVGGHTEAFPGPAPK